MQMHNAVNLDTLLSMLDNRDSDLNAVTIFLAIVEARTFRGAAKALNVPASTVSAKLAQLENELGTRLLQRTTRVVRLTDAGRRYHELVTPAIEALVEAKRAISDLRAAPKGLLRATAPTELGMFVFGPVLKTYLSLYPEVRVHIDLTSRHVNLIEEGFDLALRVGKLRDSSFISRALGGPQPYEFCASRAYLAQRGTPKHPSDLAQHACLLMQDHQLQAEWRFTEKRKAIAVKVSGAVSVNSFALLRELAIAGFGIARLPRFIAAPALADGSLRAVLREYVVEQSFHVLYPSSRHLSPKVRAFLEVLEQEFTRIVQ